MRSLFIFAAGAMVMLAALILVAWAVPSAVSPTSAEGSSMHEYHAALEAHPGSTDAIDEGLERFKNVFAGLAEEGIGDKVRALYADELYFNDTLLTIRSSRELAAYMEKTGKQLSTSEVEVEQVVRDGVDVFARWRMHFESSAMGKRIDSNSIGMTHLRFNADGQIVLHQDFWDSATGLYEHLPVIGFVLRRARAAME